MTVAVAFAVGALVLGVLVAVTLRSRRRAGRWQRSARRRGGMIDEVGRWDGGR